MISERIQKTWASKMMDGANSSTLVTMSIERANDMAQAPDRVLNIPSSISTTTVDIVPTADGTIIEDGGTQSKGSYDDRA